MDKYKSYVELKRHENRNHFRIRRREGWSGVAIVAPHGGGIEPGTTEIAERIAGTEHTFYTFEGLKRTGNRDLHITSTNFDEPVGIETAQHAQRVLTIHGCGDQGEVLHIGGLDNDLKKKVVACLSTAGFRVDRCSDTTLQGASPNNICNRSKNHCGVQIEISIGLRRRMFDNLSRKGRTRTHPIYDEFISALRQAII
jgi:phage replication-related protein YjqB (UPF0714/DUF867 family)